MRESVDAEHFPPSLIFIFQISYNTSVLQLATLWGLSGSKRTGEWKRRHAVMGRFTFSLTFSFCYSQLFNFLNLATGSSQRFLRNYRRLYVGCFSKESAQKFKGSSRRSITFPLRISDSFPPLPADAGRLSLYSLAPCLADSSRRDSVFRLSSRLNAVLALAKPTQFFAISLSYRKACTNFCSMQWRYFCRPSGCPPSAVGEGTCNLRPFGCSCLFSLTYSIYSSQLLLLESLSRSRSSFSICWAGGRGYQGQAMWGSDCGVSLMTAVWSWVRLGRADLEYLWHLLTMGVGFFPFSLPSFSPYCECRSTFLRI